MAESHEKLVHKLFEDAGFTSAQAKILFKSHNSVVETLSRMIDDKLKPIERTIEGIENDLEEILLKIKDQLL